MNPNQENNKSFSVGFIRDDGDLQLIATLNNHDDLFNCHVDVVAAAIKAVIQTATDRNDIVLLEREDAPDYVTMPNSENK